MWKLGHNRSFTKLYKKMLVSTISVKTKSQQLDQNCTNVNFIRIKIKYHILDRSNVNKIYIREIKNVIKSQLFVWHGSINKSYNKNSVGDRGYKSMEEDSQQKFLELDILTGAQNNVTSQVSQQNFLELSLVDIFVLYTFLLFKKIHYPLSFHSMHEKISQTQIQSQTRNEVRVIYNVFWIHLTVRKLAMKANSSLPKIQFGGVCRVFHASV